MLIDVRGQRRLRGLGTEGEFDGGEVIEVGGSEGSVSLGLGVRLRDHAPRCLCDRCRERRSRGDAALEVRDPIGHGGEGALRRGDLVLGDRDIGRVFTRGSSVMAGYFRDAEATEACLTADGWLDIGDMGYLSDGYIYIVGRAKDMIIVNGRNHWPQDIEWAVEQLPGFKQGDIAAFAITTPGGEETPAVLVQCRTSDVEERSRLRDEIRDRVRAVTGMNCVIELVPPRTLPRTSAMTPKVSGVSSSGWKPSPKVMPGTSSRALPAPLDS